jgi:hypothetical protein
MCFISKQNRRLRRTALITYLGVVVSVRTWSFARFWSVTALIWVAAGLVSGMGSQNEAPAHIIALGLAFVPAFVAGEWAGTHPEIRDWPLARLLAMWLFAILAVMGMSDALRDARFVASVVLAPVAILTVRWVEMLGSRRSTIGRGEPFVPPPPTPVPVSTPSSGTPIP